MKNQPSRLSQYRNNISMPSLKLRQNMQNTRALGRFKSMSRNVSLPDINLNNSQRSSQNLSIVRQAVRGSFDTKRL